METKTNRTGVQGLVAYEVALEVIRSLRGVVVVIRRHDGRLAQQIVASASSIAANVAEASRRVGKDRRYLLNVAAGSANETRAHLQVAMAWGWLQAKDIARPMAILDRELRLLWGLTR